MSKPIIIGGHRDIDGKPGFGGTQDGIGGTEEIDPYEGD